MTALRGRRLAPARVRALRRRCAAAADPGRRPRALASRARRALRAASVVSPAARGPRRLHGPTDRRLRPGLALRGGGARPPRAAPHRGRDRHRRRRAVRADRRRRGARASARSTSGGSPPTAAASSCRCKDALAGTPGGTYGGGRYLLDTVKGADLGPGGGAGIARARLQLRLQPVVRLRPGVGLPARAAGQHGRGARSRSASGTRGALSAAHGRGGTLSRLPKPCVRRASGAPSGPSARVDSLARRMLRSLRRRTLPLLAHRVGS